MTVLVIYCCTTNSYRNTESETYLDYPCRCVGWQDLGRWFLCFLWGWLELWSPGGFTEVGTFKKSQSSQLAVYIGSQLRAQLGLPAGITQFSCTWHLYGA